MKPPAGAFGTVVTEAGRRMSDRVNLAAAAGDRGKWLAVRLSDGGTDGVTYERRQDAVRHQLHETQCLYVMVPRSGVMTPAEADSFLRSARAAYDAGFRFIDPEPDTTTRIYL